MNLPFWPFNKLRYLQTELDESDSQCDKYMLEAADLRRDLAAAKEKLVSQDAALLVVKAVNSLAADLAAQIAYGTSALQESLKGVQHSVGAVATAQDKASNVQREWLEVSKGQR
jgi:hypothetical protein